MKNIYPKLNADLSNKIIAFSPLFGPIIKTIHLTFHLKIKNIKNQNYLNVRLAAEISLGNRLSTKKKKIHYRFNQTSHQIISETITLQKENCQNILKMLTFYYIPKSKRDNWKSFLSKKLSKIPQTFNSAQFNYIPTFSLPFYCLLLASENLEGNKNKIQLKLFLHSLLFLKPASQKKKINSLVISKIFFFQIFFEHWLSRSSYIYKKELE